MQLSMILALLHLQFICCQDVSLSGPVLSRNYNILRDNADDTILGNFFTEFEKKYLRKEPLPDIVVHVTSSTTGLGKAQPLLSQYPHVICVDSVTCVYPEKLMNSESFIVIFLNDFDEQTVGKKVTIFSSCRIGCKFLFIFEGVMNNSKLLSFASEIVKQSIIFCELAHVDVNAITIYSALPTKNCSISMYRTYTWRPGTNLNGTNFWSFQSMAMVTNLGKCPIRIGTFDSMPQMNITENKNGSLAIVSGVEGKLILRIAEKLNFSIVVKHPSELQQQRYSGNYAILRGVADGDSDFAIGAIRPENIPHVDIVPSRPYGMECVTWAVPRRMRSTYNILWAEYNWKVWILIGLVFIVVCLIAFTYHHVHLSKTGNPKGVDYAKLVLDVIAINVSYPVIYMPISTGARFMLIVCLFYGTIMTTGYKTSLASLIATEVEFSSAIHDAQGILGANMQLGGTLYNLEILKNQADNSKLMSKLAERYQVYNNNSDALQRLKSNNDFAYLARRSTLHYAKQMTIAAHELINFDILDGCVLAYPVVMAFPRGSYYLKPLNEMILRMQETAMFSYWFDPTYEKTNILKLKYADMLLKERNGQKLSNVFILYCVCLILSILVFLMELLCNSK